MRHVGSVTLSDLFKRNLTFSERVEDANRFSFPEMLVAFTWRVVDGLEFDSIFERMQKVDTQRNRNRLKRMWLYYMSTKCLDFLPQNIAKIKHGFREKT